ncbi:hypothetical protein AGABI2DRAFT_118963 [Agaricus bisporus var. bisporus H97]|uniref:hypothetical protein n=1 Tax=Agaricus bisporus var. bisporus (strain H97 / ATCC MYA-4626 / FGSC 10389) TaxID=936046 RepID=UPI00029F801B|nr:hypothetical protein AGABI2DRAFT_118963 [Agaricus bisporus var. bisporus H97]EKV46783.1 hypothetical protein AGABI2DRAFT_118963 [Agaricus bisporus var. bisporus H97]
MDTDWCLTCNKRVDGARLYCSHECQYGPGPSTHRRSFPRPTEPFYRAYLDDEGKGCERLLLEDDSNDSYSVEAVSRTDWAGRGFSGIRAWAAEIPLGAQPDDQEPVSASSDDSSSISSTSSTSSIYRAPNLVRPSRPLPPSLTMSKSDFSITTPPRPILKLHNHLAALSPSGSQGSTARTSVASDDSLPTPVSAPFSALPGRPFPSISDARASDLAACTQLNTYGLPPATSSPQEIKFPMRPRLPITPGVLSFPQSSVNDFETSPPFWATKSKVARYATQAATPHYRSGVRKDSEASRGRRATRVAA